MTSFFRKLTWWLHRRRKEDELREELQFHLSEEADEHQADGLTEDQARWAARRDLGNVTLLREDARTLWTWTSLEQFAQDLRYALRTMFKNRAFTALAALSLALGIGANTAIYSFMDSILLRSLPVPDPASLVVVNWRSGPLPSAPRAGPSSSCTPSTAVSIATRRHDGSHFPVPGIRALATGRGTRPVQPLRVQPGRDVNVMVKGEAELARGEYVSGDFFRGLAVSPAAGRPLVPDDDRAGAPPVAVISMGYSQRRFGGAANATGQPILINNVPFTVVGVAPPSSSAWIPARPRRLSPAAAPISSSTRSAAASTSIRTTTGSR